MAKPIIVLDNYPYRNQIRINDRLEFLSDKQFERGPCRVRVFDLRPDVISVVTDDDAAFNLDLSNLRVVSSSFHKTENHTVFFAE
jgi:hypothetical protein